MWRFPHVTIFAVRSREPTFGVQSWAPAQSADTALWRSCNKCCPSLSGRKAAPSTSEKRETHSFFFCSFLETVRWTCQLRWHFKTIIKHYWVLYVRVKTLLHQWHQYIKQPSPRLFFPSWLFSGLLTAEASCSSVMSSTNMGRTAGSSGSASAEPIIRRVIPCNKNNSISQLCGRRTSYYMYPYTG